MIAVPRTCPAVSRLRYLARCLARCPKRPCCPALCTPLYLIRPFTLLFLSSLPPFPSSPLSLLRLSPLPICHSWLLILPRGRARSPTFPPPLLSPLSGAAADSSAIVPPPLISPFSAQQQTTPPIFLRLLFLPLAVLQQTTPPIFLRLLFLPSAAQQQTNPPIFLCLLFLP
ncbi:unnamed protein product [Closterium sp. NIES-65]|nr:unnamed protein product [Closterium sp. NIES-65]